MDITKKILIAAMAISLVLFMGCTKKEAAADSHEGHSHEAKCCSADSSKCCGSSALKTCAAGETKTCGTKKCCSDDPSKCCGSKDAKTCPADCTKPCCAKKCCSDDPSKCCGSKDAKTCPADCAKPCCAAKDALEGAKESVENATDQVTALASSLMEKAKQAADFSLKNFDATEVKLSDMTGKIVVIEWFNYECPFTKYAYDNNIMAEVAKKYADKNVHWVAINSTAHQTTEQNKTFAEKHGLDYILDDRNGLVGRAFGAKTTPHMYVIDTKGSIVYEGAIDNSPLGKGEAPYKNYVDEALAKLTAGQPVETTETKPYGCSVKYKQ